MPLQLGDMYRWIEGELRQIQSTAESMQLLIDECERASGGGDWEPFRGLDYGDLQSVLDWIRRPFREDPPERPLRALWFGLFNPIRPDVGAVADIYVCGSERFEPDPMDMDWAVGPEWWPEGRYAESSVLTDIYRIAYAPGGLGNDAEYPLCLGYGAFAVREALTKLDPNQLLGNSSSLGIAVGFDSGDFLLLGEFRADGLHPITS